MIILIDTREQQIRHITTELDRMGIEHKRHTLKFGDYSFILDGKNYENEIVIERKGSLTELAGNLTIGKKRFENEFKRAMLKKCKIHLAVEDGSLERIRQHKYRSTLNPSEYLARLNTWGYKFQFVPEFVQKYAMSGYIVHTFKKYLGKVVTS